VWSGDDVVLIAQEPGEHSVRVADIQVGQRGALHARAAGKILLARSAADKRDRILKDLPLKKLTKHTITRRAKLEQELERAATNGWAMDDEEFARGVTCIAAGLEYNGTDFALAILAPAERLKQNSSQYLAALLEAARP
jgi:IclR family acetate operon transcriptional repressor